MKKQDVEVKMFREGFDTYEYLTDLISALQKANFAIGKRLGNGLGSIDDKNDIFTDEEILRYQKLANALERAYTDLYEKKSKYQETLIYRNLRLDKEETTEENVDEFY